MKGILLLIGLLQFFVTAFIKDPFYPVLPFLRKTRLQIRYRNPGLYNRSADRKSPVRANIN